MENEENKKLSGDQPKPSCVVHERADSGNDLQALFEVLDPKKNITLSKPMKMRNLPNSFFQPSSVRRHSPAPTASHSREGSADSSYGSRGGGPGPIRVSGTMSPQPPTPMHFRHHSSPATLQQSFAVAQQPSTLVRHTRQHSYDALAAEDYVPLPEGWEQATTPEGQVYYLNHNTQTTQWDDPRKKASASSPAPKAPPAAPAPAVSTAAPRPAAPPTELAMPDGWEQAVTASGDTYFINHKDKTTHWLDPRIPPHLQPSPLAKGQQLSLQVSSAPIGSPQQMSPHHGARSPAPMRPSPDARRKASTTPLATSLSSVNNNPLPPAAVASATSILNNNMSPHHQLLRQQQQQLTQQQQQQLTSQQQQLTPQQQQLTITTQLTSQQQQQQLPPQQQQMTTQQQQLTNQQQQQINPQQQSFNVVVNVNQQQQQLSQQQQQIPQQLSQQQIQQQVAYRSSHGRQDSSDSGVGLVTGLKGISITGPDRRQEVAPPPAPSLMETTDAESVMDSDDLMPTISLPSDFLVSQIMSSDRMDDDEWL